MFLAIGLSQFLRMRIGKLVQLSARGKNTRRPGLFMPPCRRLNPSGIVRSITNKEILAFLIFEMSSG